MSDVVLVYPKTGYDYGAGITPPFSILATAAPVQQAGYKIKLIDQRIESKWKELLEKELKQQPLCVGISSMTGLQLGNAIEIAKFIRQVSPGTLIVWGGVHVSLMPEQSLHSSFVDIVVRNEGEETFRELVDAISKSKGDRKKLYSGLGKIKGISFKADGKIVSNQERSFVDIEKVLPTPWGLIDVEKYVLSNVIVSGSRRELDIGETSRGCPFNCAFCYNAVFNKSRWRAMSAKKAFEKVKSDAEAFNLDVVWLRDDSFFTNEKRVKEFCRLMIDDGLDVNWYSSGMRIDSFNRMDDETISLLQKTKCHSFRFGVESGCNRVLKLINKGITKDDVYNANNKAKKHCLEAHYSFMAGFPTETEPEVIETVDMMLKLKKDYAKAHMHAVNIFTPYPGTELFDLSVKMGMKVPQTMEEWKEFHHLNVFTPGISAKQNHLIQTVNDISYYTSDALSENMPSYLKPLFFPMNKWLSWRWRNKKFGFAPELKAMKFARKTFFGI